MTAARRKGRTETGLQGPAGALTRVNAQTMSIKLLLIPLAASAILAQPTPPAGAVERIRVHGKSLEGNLSADSPDRDVSVYLPPSYKKDRNRRYPVVYMLHGFTDSDEKWFTLKTHWINLPAVLDKALAAPASREVIVVMPNAFTRYQGSMYSSSVTTGDWEQFIARELVAFIDSHYRTVASPASRGLAGHSMGGFGALRIGMKRPDVFSSIYLLSPCCMAPPDIPQPPPPALAKLEAIKSVDEIAKADFMTKAMFASAAAWSPNPKNPPFYADLPVKDGAYQASVAARWAANAPLAMVDQYVGNLRALKAIALDAGDQDKQIAGTIRTLDRMLNDYGIQHAFDIYEGNHLNRVAGRIETKMMPFFATTLVFPKGKR